MRFSRWLVGAVLALGLAGSVATAEPVPNRYFLFKINVSNLDRSLDFYTRLVGLREVRRAGGKNGAALEVVLSQSGQDLEPELILVYKEGGKPPELGTGLNMLAFAVPDLKERVAAMEKAGYAMNAPVREAARSDLSFATGIAVVFTKDPDGYPVELLQWNR